MFERLLSLRLAVLTTLQVASGRLVPAGAPAQRKGATMIEYILFAAFGVAVAIVVWNVVMPEADSVLEQIACLFEAGSGGIGGGANC